MRTAEMLVEWLKDEQRRGGIHRARLLVAITPESILVHRRLIGHIGADRSAECAFLLQLRVQQFLRTRTVHVLLGDQVNSCVYCRIYLFTFGRCEGGFDALVSHAIRILDDKRLGGTGL